MIQKRSCALSTKVKLHFYDIAKIRLVMVNNVNILPNMNLAKPSFPCRFNVETRRVFVEKLHKNFT